MDSFEAAVYLGIVAIASGGVFFTIWLMIRSVQPKKARQRKMLAAVKVAPTKALPEGKEQKQSKSRKKDKKKNKDEEKELIQLKEYPEHKLIENKKAAATLPELPDMPQRPKGKTLDETGPEQEAKKPVESELAAGEATEGQEDGNVELPELPSLDTLTDGEEEKEEGAGTEDLMSVFDVDEAEDSTVSDLAANLFDVDAENIEKLGSEVSQILGEMRSR